MGGPPESIHPRTVGPLNESVADPGFREGGFRDGAAKRARHLKNIINIHNFCSNARARNDHEAENDISC